MKRFKVYLKVWWLMSRNSFMSMIVQRFGAVTFLIGKLIRFAFFLLFIVFLLKGVKTVAGYNVNEIAFFYLTYNLLDVLAQFLFREVYRFRRMIIDGSFDLVLVKPISALFRSLMGGADILDLFTLPPLIIAIVVLGRTFDPSLIEAVYYFILVVNGLLIATAFHIAVLSMAIITLEIDHTVMIYRDIVNMGRLPIEIYKEPLRSVLTFIVPVGLMISLPSKALLGLISLPAVLGTIVLGIALFLLSIRFWHFALTRYTSASS